MTNAPKRVTGVNRPSSSPWMVLQVGVPDSADARVDVAEQEGLSDTDGSRPSVGPARA